MAKDHDPHPRYAPALLHKLTNRARILARGGRDKHNTNQVGLLPQKGWGKRNIHFFKNVLMPNLFSPRTGMPERPDLSSPEGDQFKVTWIGHASYLVQTPRSNFLIDPNWGNWLACFKRMRHPGMPLDHLPKIDGVLVTHAHYDHLHIQTLRRIAGGQPILVPKGVGKLVRNKGFGEIVELSPWEEFKLSDSTITMTPAKHWGARHVHDVHRGFGGYMIENHARRSVYHCGDSAYFDGFSEIGKRWKIDLAMLPIGAYQAMSGREVHMNPEEALRAFVELQAEHMTPMHYGTFPLGGEPMHEPIQRLKAATKENGLTKKVSILHEGRPHLF